ncbi:MAG: hypothetical protein MJE68_03265, partial [Proteobacteria bacterium]|nr:hypothetical protein [Pseudomonadota bacterium]
IFLFVFMYQGVHFISLSLALLLWLLCILCYYHPSQEMSEKGGQQSSGDSSKEVGNGKHY